MNHARNHGLEKSPFGLFYPVESVTNYQKALSTSPSSGKMWQWWLKGQFCLSHPLRTHTYLYQLEL